MGAADKDENAPGANCGLSTPITCEREFLEALRARRHALDIGYETIEAMADMPPRYAAKLLSGKRPIGALSMWLLLNTLGLSIRLVEDAAGLARNQRHHQWQTVLRKPRTRRWTLREIAMARRRNAPWLWDSERARKIGSLGNLSRRKKADASASLSAMKRAAAMARWHR